MKCDYCTRPARFHVFDVDGVKLSVCDKHIDKARDAVNQMPGAWHVKALPRPEQQEEQDDGEF
jgi:hypothetical protein